MALLDVREEMSRATGHSDGAQSRGIHIISIYIIAQQNAQLTMSGG